MAFYVPTPSWQRVGTGVGAVTIRCIGAVRVAVSTTEPAADAGSNYGWSFHGPNNTAFDALGGDVWVKAANTALSPDGFFSAIWIEGAGTFETSTVLPPREYLVQPVDPVDPPSTVTMYSPDAWPTEGSTVTITKGTSTGVLTLDGADVTGDATDTGPTLVYVVPAGGLADRTLTWAPASGDAVSLTVYTALRDEFDIALDRHLAPIGALPSSYTAGGRLALTFGEAGSAQGLVGQPQVTADGLLHNGTNLYQRCQSLSAYDFDGMIVVLDFDLATPASSDTLLQIDTSGDGRSLFSLNSTDALQMTTMGGNIESGTPRFVIAAGRVQIAYMLDMRTGQAKWIASNGFESDWVATTNTPGGVIEALDIRAFGASGSTTVEGTIEAFVKFRAPVGNDPLGVGTDFPVAFDYYWQRVADVRRQDLSGTQMVAVIPTGQSNVLGGPTSGDAETLLEYQTWNDAVMPADLAGTIRGPASNDATGVTSTGFIPIELGGNITMGYGAARVWNNHTANPMTVAVMAAGIGGASAENLDGDPLTGDGSLIVVSNWSHILSETIRLAGLAGKSVPRVAMPVMQGGADESMTVAEYQPIFDGWMADHSAEAASQGVELLVWLYQMNGDANRGAGEVMGPALAQLEWARLNDCIFIATAPYEIHDANTHLTGDSQLVLGELAPRLQIEKDAGNAVPNPLPSVVRDSATQITITIPKRADMTLARDTGRYGVTVDHGGLEVEGGGAITDVVLANQETTATLTVTVSGTVAHIRNALQAGVSPNTAFVTGMTEWFIDTGWSSDTVDGVDLQHFLPIFREAV